MANHIGFDKINTNTPVKKITHKRGKITGLVCGNSKITDPEMVISSLPLDKTIHLMDPTPPNEILLAVNEIGYRNIRICVLFLDTPFFSENASIYFPDRKLNFTRIYEPKNRSAHMAPMDKTCIVIECPYDSGDQLSSMRNDEFYEMIINDLVNENLIKKDQIIDYDIFDMNNAYPILDLNMKEKKKKILSYLHTFENMYLIGRNAEFQYLHTHDIIAKGRKLIESFS
jgi:protoporphyrinogen oxidase